MKKKRKREKEWISHYHSHTHGTCTTQIFHKYEHHYFSRKLQSVKGEETFFLLVSPMQLGRLRNPQVELRRKRFLHALCFILGARSEEGDGGSVHRINAPLTKDMTDEAMKKFSSLLWTRSWRYSNQEKYWYTVTLTRWLEIDWDALIIYSKPIPASNTERVLRSKCSHFSNTDPVKT